MGYVSINLVILTGCLLTSSIEEKKKKRKTKIKKKKRWNTARKNLHRNFQYHFFLSGPKVLCKMLGIFPKPLGELGKTSRTFINCTDSIPRPRKRLGRLLLRDCEKGMWINASYVKLLWYVSYPQGIKDLQ